MPPPAAKRQLMTANPSSSSSCDLQTRSSQKNECVDVDTQMDSLTENVNLAEGTHAISTDELDDAKPSDEIETQDDPTSKGSACTAKNESEEQRSATTQQKQNAEDQTIVNEDEDNENEKGKHPESHDIEANAPESNDDSLANAEDQKIVNEDEDNEKKTEKHPESHDIEANAPESNDDSLKNTEAKSGTQKNADDDIEWLTPFSMPRVKEDETETQEEDDNKDAKSKDNPLKILKKGAVAAVGGSMVGLGLVMIPLPTPFGAVVASSGLAVLGTEFDEAKELNDRLIDGAKGHLNKARDSMVKGIEKMNKDESNADTSTGFSERSEDETHVIEKKGEGEIVKVNAAKSFESDKKTEDDVSEGKNDVESDNASENPPMWLHMNPVEQQRQAKLAKAKYRRDRQTPYENAKEAITRKTGKFLSKNLLPLLKKMEPPAAEEEPSVVDPAAEEQSSVVDASTLPQKGDVNHNQISVAEIEEDIETDENRVDTKPETKDEEVRESHSTEANDIDNEEYVVVS